MNPVIPFGFGVVALAVAVIILTIMCVRNTREIVRLRDVVVYVATRTGVMPGTERETERETEP